MTETRPVPGRLPSLDGLRGAAAIVVLLHHALLTIPGFAAVYWGLPSPDFVQPVAYTPLHVFWAGPEAVLVFFVLSGVVLTLPAARQRALPWVAYYPSRLIRLYVPVAFAVAFAMTLARVWPRATDGRYSPWVQMHNEAPTLAIALKNLFLLDGTTWLNSPLWSLQWEVLFSLLLPVYVWMAVRWGRTWWPVIAPVLVALVLLGTVTGTAAGQYLPYFGLGALIAVNVDRVAALADRFDRSRRSIVIQGALMAGAILLLTFRWWPGAGIPAAFAWFVQLIVVLGAVSVVLVALAVPLARRVLSSRALLVAGAISFSLYLVHEPILVTLAVVIPPAYGWIAPVLGIPLALLASWLFYVLIERTTHRLARRAARSITSRAASTPRRGEARAPIPTVD